MHIYIYTGMRGRVSKNGDVRDYVCKLNCWKVDMINERLQTNPHTDGDWNLIAGCICAMILSVDVNAVSEGKEGYHNACYPESLK